MSIKKRQIRRKRREGETFKMRGNIYLQVGPDELEFLEVVACSESGGLLLTEDGWFDFPDHHHIRIDV